jgi:hypothetical protein
MQRSVNYRSECLFFRSSSSAARPLGVFPHSALFCLFAVGVESPTSILRNPSGQTGGFENEHSY